MGPYYLSEIVKSRVTMDQRDTILSGCVLLHFVFELNLIFSTRTCQNALSFGVNNVHEKWGYYGPRERPVASGDTIGKSNRSDSLKARCCRTPDGCVDPGERLFDAEAEQKST